MFVGRQPNVSSSLKYTHGFFLRGKKSICFVFLNEHWQRIQSLSVCSSLAATSAKAMSNKAVIHLIRKISLCFKKLRSSFHSIIFSLDRAWHYISGVVCSRYCWFRIIYDQKLYCSDFDTICILRAVHALTPSNLPLIYLGLFSSLKILQSF